MAGVILNSTDDCDMNLGLCSDGVLNGDFGDPLYGDVGANGDDEADEYVLDGLELPEPPIANWKIVFNAFLFKTGAVCGESIE